MEAPKCKLCGERHYGLCKGLAFEAKTRSGEAVPLEVKQVLVDDERGLHVEFKTLAAFTPTGGETLALKFDRTKYQREYMRKRRAAAKLKRP